MVSRLEQNNRGMYFFHLKLTLFSAMSRVIVCLWRLWPGPMSILFFLLSFLPSKPIQGDVYV